MTKEIMLERYDEEKGVVKFPLSEAIENEMKHYRSILNLILTAKKPCKMTTFRRWKTSETNDVTIKLIVEPNEVKNESDKK